MEDRAKNKVAHVFMAHSVDAHQMYSSIST